MSRKILIVDDEEDIRTVATASLELVAGWTVVTVTSGADAVDTAIREKPDAILLDVMMPGIDGPATLGQLRSDAATRDIPVVFLTAKVQPAERRRLSTMAVAGVLAKPFDPLALAEQVSAVLGWQ